MGALFFQLSLSLFCRGLREACTHPHRRRPCHRHAPQRRIHFQVPRRQALSSTEVAATVAVASSSVCSWHPAVWCTPSVLGSASGLVFSCRNPLHSGLRCAWSQESAATCPSHLTTCLTHFVSIAYCGAPPTIAKGIFSRGGDRYIAVCIAPAHRPACQLCQASSVRRVRKVRDAAALRSFLPAYLSIIVHP